MQKRSQKTKETKKSKKERQRREEYSQIFDDSSKRIEQEFHTLLEESGFMSQVIEIYRKEELRKFEYHQKYGSTRSSTEFEENFQRQEDFLRTYLPNWLFQLTDTLAVEALFAASGEPMLKSRADDLYKFIFIERGPGDPPLKDARNEIWNSHALKWAMNEALPKIKTIANVTLNTLAKKINELPKRGWLQKRRKALTGKHLQKLLKEHNIDWMKIKKDYIKQLEEKKRSKKTTSKRKNE